MVVVVLFLLIVVVVMVVVMVVVVLVLLLVVVVVVGGPVHGVQVCGHWCDYIKCEVWGRRGLRKRLRADHLDRREPL